jgi:hypothetical protein
MPAAFVAMTKRLFQILAFATLMPVALGGAFGHVDGSEVLSQGTFLFHPDHPAHAPFVPQKEHPCAACAVANVTPPVSSTLLFAPPMLGTAGDARCSWRAPASTPPELPGRSPPFPTV